MDFGGDHIASTYRLDFCLHQHRIGLVSEDLSMPHNTNLVFDNDVMPLNVIVTVNVSCTDSVHYKLTCVSNSGFTEFIPHQTKPSLEINTVCETVHKWQNY
ncbi:hypothetical protein TNCT_202191 [Trichonephila clavata]|uniref:Uncharacterized protein n=1 Tax=Trichonephila clavata TaxID=2740835 RepID=A0A8X6IN99_TRICU|nr:hypothetical protein TNCT_202191 [Trichonephila clavata]